MNRISVIQILDNLPEEFDPEAFIKKLLFIKKVKKGMQDASEGRTISLQEEANTAYQLQPGRSSVETGREATACASA